MKVSIAGFNVDYTVLKEAIINKIDKELLTPEIISAAYARISRSSKTIDQLRENARNNIPRARKSNTKIVFEMGHSSIAEHAVFNIDIEGVSRFALEEIERHRIGSYTEKSQRYVEIGNDFIIPQEIKDENFEKEFENLNQNAAKTYFRLLEDGVSKEDARYYLPFSTTGNLGTTLNARSLEHMILAFSASPVKEMNELAEKLYEKIKSITPSLIRYIKPNGYNKNEYSVGVSTINEKVQDFENNVDFENAPIGYLNLQFSPENIDDKILTIREIREKGISFNKAKNNISALTHEEKLNKVKIIFNNIKPFDSVPNDFEHINLTWEIVISGAAFAQLKRHRISSQGYSAYNPSLGFTHPPDCTGKDYVLELIKESENLYDKIISSSSKTYALLIGHRRRMIWTANLREHYHFARLREDPHAQWDIRGFAFKMNEIIRKIAPISSSILGGKDNFDRLYQELME
jgi:flavin-dependent thymidylate synthase